MFNYFQIFVISRNTEIRRDSNFIYPYGATLNIVEPAAVALSTGMLAIPNNRPICAYYSGENKSGRLVVLGSSRILSDAYIDKEDNDKLGQMIFEFFDSTVERSINNVNRVDDTDVSIHYVKKSVIQYTFIGSFFA